MRGVPRFRQVGFVMPGDERTPLHIAPFFRDRDKCPEMGAGRKGGGLPDEY